MGCWNRTCGLSRLPITYNMPVYVYVLEQNTRKDSMCYSTCLYTPILIPFYTNYNDYGAGEDSSGPFLEIILDTIKNRLVELDLGKNPYHDLSVKRADWNEKVFWNSIHEQRLIVDGAAKKHLNVSMMRKDVVETVLDNWTQGTYTTGRYVKYKLQDLLDMIPDVIQRAEEKIKSCNPLTAAFVLNFESLYDWEGRPIIASWLVREYRFGKLLNVDQLFFEFVQAKDCDKAAALLKEYLKTMWLDSYMHEIRALWTPGGFDGSQANNPDAYKFLSNTILDILHKEEVEEDF